MKIESEVILERCYIDYCKDGFLRSLSKLERPSFDEYFLQLSIFVSLRSDDLYVKHGAVIVDNLSKHIIGTGYNGTFRKSGDSLVDKKDRDLRRPFMIHAEENAIMNSSINPLSLKDGATIYVTGLPCVNCLQRIINFGISEIIMLDRNGSITENEETIQMRKSILENSNVKIREIPVDNLFKTVYNNTVG